MEKKVKNKLSKKYESMVEKESPPSNIVINCIKAFIVGGIICTIGQGFMNFFIAFGVDKEQLGSCVSLVMIFLGAFLTGIGVYDKIGSFAGAGSIVPITGFANSIVSPAMEFKREGYILGVGAKMFVIAGPVLVYGISSSIIVGIIYYFIK
ncbi:stage V sporulation protein AC [Clostridium sp.]|uniref:stage V sporulation protein AC n=1 Tax=Clostridium sp. TaxID=1506 RepID=UPI003FA52A7A